MDNNFVEKANMNNNSNNNKDEPSEITDFWGNVIHSYSRAQALEDGVLVDVSDMAREAGWKFPVAVTAALWADIETNPLMLPK